MSDRVESNAQPRYIISAAASLAECHPQTLRHYERLGLVSPVRTRGNVRLYTDQDIEQLRRIQRMMEDLGVNLAGVEVILHMRRQILELRAELEALRTRVERLDRHES
ncbi:MAG: helix-turn-helix transcriptional regulator [Chloroflexota bacterium]|nr:helix-turn-helix transcriptional regulator [Chloroflexota bacterium]